MSRARELHGDRMIGSADAVPATSAPVLSAAETDLLARALFEALASGVPIDPPTETHPGLGLDDAYAVQQELVALHAAAGRRVCGRKIGLTSAAMREQLGVQAPDFGVLLDAYTFAEGATVSMSGVRAILPRLEGEIGFVLRTPLAGRPGAPVTAADVRAATLHVLPVFELIDSRVRDWRIGLSDTVADNASCLGAVLGTPVPLDRVAPLPGLALRLTRDGEVLQEGTGEAVMGDPAEAVAWLANELGRRGEELPAGQPVLSGSLTAAVPADPGTYVAAFDGGLGSVTVEIEA